MLTDTHCHLNHSDFEEDWQAALERARSADVRRLLVVGFDLPSSRRAVSLAQQEPDLQAVIGIHPESSGEWSADTLAELNRMLRDAGAKVAAWGEIGLDYHWETVSRQGQRAVFAEQIEAANTACLPIVIHCRDAYGDLLPILREANAERVVLHCFTGTWDEAKAGLDLGYYLGFGGIVTFKKSDDLREVARRTPLDRILLETDSPYLAPQKWRGKRNEPAYITEVARVVADLHGLSPTEIAQITTANADRLFGYPVAEQPPPDSYTTEVGWEVGTEMT